VPEDNLRQLDQRSRQALFAKAGAVLDEHKLQLTKDWLSRVISDIEQLETLETFPTQESIRTSVELIEGLAAALRDEGQVDEFLPGGRYYQRAAALGTAVGAGDQAFLALFHHLLALETAIWQILIQALRREDRELLALVVRLRTCLHGIQTASAESYHLRSSSELDRLAHTDPLTGLYNRRYLVQELERHVEIFKRYHHPFAVLMLDLDNLKWLNDTYGHPAGDAALSHLAMLIRVNVRDVDIPCRFGGDEFVVLMPETEKSAVEIVGQRIAESLTKTKLKVESSLVSLEASVGISACPADGRDAEELLQEADASLYRAKQHKHAGLGGK